MPTMHHSRSGTGEDARVLSWATDLDDRTLEQAERSASLPIVRGHVALMPDAHYGYGATVGSVIPTEGAVIPAAVGVDIGCGMIAARLPLTSADLPDDLQRLHGMIARDVPAGVGTGHSARHRVDEPPALPATSGESWWTPKLATKAHDQFGSLGSGNHFVEVCLDEADRLWIVLHSGSRGVGYQLANFHIDTAKALAAATKVGDLAELPDRDLAWLSEGSPEFDAYITDMLWAQDYALGNRQRMLGLVHGAVARFMGRDPDQVPIVDEIDCHHNFTDRETHVIEGAPRRVWLTRKGAIRARAGDRGVIPGSMGTESFVVSGLGSPESYQSCAHGAGRRMSRTAARKRLDPDGLRSAMRGTAWNRNANALIDEDPRAYKDIDRVMSDQEDLVRVEHRLRQILNYKGT